MHRPRRTSTRHAIALLAAIVVGGQVLLTPPAQAIKGATFLLTARYQGKYHYEYAGAGVASDGSATADYEWDEKVSSWVSGDTAEVVSSTETLEVKVGTLHIVEGKVGGGMTLDCQFFPQVPAERKPAISFKYVVGVKDGRITTYGASVFLPTVGRGLASSGSCNGARSPVAAGCNYIGGLGFPVDTSYGGSGPFCAMEGPSPPAATFDGPGVVYPIIGSQVGVTDIGTFKRSVDATVTISHEGAAAPKSPSPPSPRKTPDEIRVAVLADMKAEIAKMAYPCLTLGVAAATFAILGPAGPIIGGTMAAFAAPWCLTSLKIVQDLNLTYNDPPVDNFSVVAVVPKNAAPPVTLPACPASPAVTATRCTALQAAVLDYLEKLQGVADVASTFATTIGRESAAGGAGDANAVALQQQAGLALVPQLAAVDAARAAAGARLAAALRAFGAKGRLTKAQVTVAYAAIMKRLVDASVSEAEIRATIGAALKPTPIDVLTVVARR